MAYEVVAVGMTRCSRERSEQRVTLSWFGVGSAEHPTLGLNLAEPVSHRGNPAEVFQYVLLADEPDGKNPAGRDRDRGAEEGLQHEDAFGMMAECAVPEVGHVALRGIEPFVQPDEIFWFAAVLLG